MKEDELEQLFASANRTKPDETSKRAAINAAMKTYREESASEKKDEKNSQSHQGNASWLRLIVKLNPFMRESDMKSNKKPVVYGALAGVSMVLLGGVLFINQPTRLNVVDDEDLAEPALVLEEEISAMTSEGTTLKREVLRKESQKRSADEHAFIAQDKDMAAPSDGGAAQVSKPQVVGELYVHSAKRKTSLQDAPMSVSAFDESKLMPPVPMPEADYVVPSGENRDRFEESDISSIKRVSEEPVSTFSVDVDTASYSYVRRQLNQGVRPQADSVRIEELVNYFDYAYPSPKKRDVPFATHVLVGDSPWKKGNKLLHIGIKGLDVKKQPRSNLVFLLDVSGSMSDADKLPLVKQSITLLLDQLQQDDTVGIVVYAGAAGTVLEPTQVKNKQAILGALERLNAGGSTAGAQGIELAYKLAEQHFNKDAVNRIILATDGDFNVGTSSPDALKELVEQKRKSGVFLSVLGFGQGNYHDALMQALAQNGNGVAAYIDTFAEAQKVLVNEANSSLFPIAKDVKVQIEFNPDTVSEYRLIGYETRHLNREDFNNDKVDAGDIGAGHTVTAIYEITPVGAESGLLPPTRYESNVKRTAKSAAEYGFLKLRYKLPAANTSKLVEQVIPSKNNVSLDGDAGSWQVREFGFSAAVAGFAQLLKDDKYMGEWSFEDAANMAYGARGEDPYGYRSEFVQLVRRAAVIKP